VYWLQKIEFGPPRTILGGKAGRAVAHQKPGTILCRGTENAQVLAPAGQSKEIGGFYEGAVFRLAYQIIAPVIGIDTKDKSVPQMKNQSAMCCQDNTA